ncbi:MAG: hypothetical protein ACM31C_05130 [Acidobacteriota bacterium]
MHRLAVLVALVACEAREAAPPPPAHYTYPPPPAAWPLGAVHARLGRSQAPQLARREGIAGDPAQPLRLPTPWSVPGKGPARAIVYGLDGEQPAVELIDVDQGKVVWRDTRTCAGPVVGVTEHVVVCTDARGTRAIGLDGKPRWKGEQAFIAMTDDHVVVAGAGEAVVLDADTGDELAHVALPAGVTSDSILASCGDAGRELFAAGQDGKLARIAEAKGGPAIAWAVAVGNVAGLEACDGASVLVTASSETGTSLVALARDTGKITGRVDGVRGYWPARDGSDRVEISTDAGVASWPRDLSAPTAVALPVLGELLGKRGERRLVRATKHAAALLDRAGVRGFVPLAEMGAVLGDDHAIAASWLGSAGHTVRRFGIPAPWRRALRVPVAHTALGVPAELRDLPQAATLDDARAVVSAAGKVRAIGGAAVDGDALYALALGDEHAGLARFDLGKRQWMWTRDSACGSPQAVGLAVAADVVVCAARGKPATVTATGKDGTPRWTWTTDDLDAIVAAGDVVVALDADHAFVLGAGQGRVLGSLASDDGDAVRAAVIDVAGTTLVVTYERGRVVARLPRVRMAPAWSIGVDGVVRALAPAGDGVLVELEDGDAFRVDARTGATTALPGIDLAWRAFGDLITGEAPGEPTPPAVMPVPPKVIAKPVPKYEVQEHEPPFSTPWKVPPPGAAAWQLTLYELAGGLRARNDYALAAPVDVAAARGPAGSPVVALYGPGKRDALVIDVERGDPVRRVVLPDEGHAFATMIAGKPVAGAVLANPLRVLLF